MTQANKVLKLVRLSLVSMSSCYVKNRIDLLLSGISNNIQIHIPNTIKQLITLWILDGPISLNINHLCEERHPSYRDRHEFEVWLNQDLSWILNINHYQFQYIPKNS